MKKMYSILMIMILLIVVGCEIPNPVAPLLPDTVTIYDTVEVEINDQFFDDMVLYVNVEVLNWSYDSTAQILTGILEADPAVTEEIMIFTKRAQVGYDISGGITRLEPDQWWMHPDWNGLIQFEMDIHYKPIETPVAWVDPQRTIGD